MTILPNGPSPLQSASLTNDTVEIESEKTVGSRNFQSAGSPQPAGTWAETMTGPATATPAPAAPSAQFPPPKTDKPRPHVCATCTRSFARLEHLKRHERSHTKEKPFECPECTRCFARRDLLLRHQQKLHLTATPSSRPRNGRRESTSSSVASTRVRKTAPAQNGPGSMRPRANTISHIDGAMAGMIAPTQLVNSRRTQDVSHHRHSSMAEFDHMLPGGQRPHPNRMLKINTSVHDVNLAGGALRTAPAFGGFPQDMGMDDLIFAGNNTINPAQLHFADSPLSMQFDTPASPFPSNFAFGRPLTLDDESSLDWINGFDSQMSFSNANEHAIAVSSPSAISGGSPPGQGDGMTDSQMHLTPEQWHDSLISQAPLVPHYDNDWGLSEMGRDPLSPAGAELGPPEVKFATPSLNGTNSVHAQPTFSNTFLSFGSHSNSPNTAASVSSGSNRHSSVTSVATDTVTDAARQSLIALLSQSAPTGQRKYSQSAVNATLAPGYIPRPRSGLGVNLPSTVDLQRYVNAYITNFHPRLPFLHIPTLNFDTLGAANSSRAMNGKGAFAFSVASGDGGCLLLSMAAIGALFEFDYTTSKELYDLAKKLIQLYLEERRRADMCAKFGATNINADSSTPSTPLWLVQSMLLNVVYGHNLGDRPPADVSSTHFTALANLARAADLARASPHQEMDDISMGIDAWGSGQQPFDEAAWYSWKVREEKKRTLYSIFVVSSVLVSLYNFAPSLTNSEIGLDLPCEENLWAAETPTAWYALGGGKVNEQGIPFAKALSLLLMTSQRSPLQPHQLQAQNRPTDVRLSTPDLPPAAFCTSSFGCLILVNALHNYIWETRQRHLGRQWTITDTDAMQGHIGPALLAYQAVWRESTNMGAQLANVSSANDLAADCVPFLDLAFVRLFLSLGRSKECFWKRDWDGISHEIAAGCEIIYPNDNAAGTTSEFVGDVAAKDVLQASDDGAKMDLSGLDTADQSSKRERHLRKAAAHAAHALHTADAHGVSLADFPSREVNLGSAICALDCAEVLAEWVSVVQERVGRHLGMLCSDEDDFDSVPSIMLLESEDTALLQKIDAIVQSAEHKLDTFQSVAGRAESATGEVQDRKSIGLAARLLKVTSRECDCAATWSVMGLMARNLEAQADHLQARALRSLAKTE